MVSKQQIGSGGLGFKPLPAATATGSKSGKVPLIIVTSERILLTGIKRALVKEFHL